MMIYPFYYLYGLIIVMVAIRLYVRFGRQFFVWTVYGVIGAVLFGLVEALRSPPAYRIEGAFNNPNQLGYFTVLAVTLLYLVTAYGKVRAWYQIPAYLAIVYTTILAQSKAAVLALVMFGVLAVLRRNLAVVATVFLIVIGYMVADPSSLVVENFMGRLAGPVQSDDTWAGRGYDRITLYPEYALLGAAEGAFRRFESQQLGELHSSLGTVLFAYGIPGTLAFLAAGLALYFAAGVRLMLFFGPIFAYGLSHQGLRFPWFWVVVGIVFCAGHYARRTAPSPVPAPRPVPARVGVVAPPE